MFSNTVPRPFPDTHILASFPLSPIENVFVLKNVKVYCLSNRPSLARPQPLVPGYETIKYLYPFHGSLGATENKTIAFKMYK